MKKTSQPFYCLIPILLGITACTGHPKEVEATSGLPEMPIPVRYENTLEYEWSKKKVLDSELLSDAEAMGSWEHRGNYGTLTLSTEKPYKGKTSLLLTSPTKGESPPPGGRPWGVSGAFYNVGNEDWTGYNRITFRIYPDLPGFKKVSINTIFYNEGEDKVPGIKNGHNFQMLNNREWNEVYWEIDHLGREKVTGFVIQYRLQGNEPGATETARYFIDEVYLEKVEPDHYEGWNIQPGQIAYNHTGYAAGFPKQAFTPDVSAKTFALIDAGTKAKVLEGAIETQATPLGTFQVADFTKHNTPGSYILEMGSLRTKPFVIGSFAAVYRGTIIKTINHFYAQRCGYPVEGIHDACHLDWLCHHGDLSVNIHGGWHDAGDLSQGLGNTAEATWGMALLAEKLKESDPVLADRLLEEARWGAAWLMKTRFGDGFRTTWSTKDMWTDDIIGNADDFQSRASNSAQSNFLAATTEASVSRAFRTKDALFADYALQCARKDFDLAEAGINNRLSADLAGVALIAALELFDNTSDDTYKQAAIGYADYIVSCQQQTDLAADVPLKGFFYRDANKRSILHYPHRGFEHSVVIGLVDICKLLSNQSTEWKKALQLYADYYKQITAGNAPYNMIPAGIYDLAAARNDEEREQISKGIRLNDQYFIKRFPVWGEFRGNSGLILTQAKGLSKIAAYLKDQELLDICYNQLEWHLGKNPFAQSLMYGEGYRFAGQYSVMSGDIVGGLPVGVQTHFNRDEPYWPAENCHNWKEIWVHPSAIWLLIMNDFI